MRNVKTAALAAMLLVLPVAASATEVPGKGVGKLGCVPPVVRGTKWQGLPVGPNHCVAVAVQFQDGWCATEFKGTKRAFPWVGPTMSRLTALERNFGQSYGRNGC